MSDPENGSGGGEGASTEPAEESANGSGSGNGGGNGHAASAGEPAASSPPPPSPTAAEGPAPIAPRGGFDRPTRYRILAIIATTVVIVDQAVKQWIVHYFHGIRNATHPVIPGTFDLIFTRNPGAAWGMLGNLQPDALRIGVFVLISIAAITMVIWLAHRARPDQKLMVIALSLVLGGALGNLVDRILVGSVVDFLDFYTHAGWFMAIAEKLHNRCDAVLGCHWPAFNVADICISTGVGLLILEGFLGSKAPASAPPPAA